jgi:hypothetical protein
VYEGSFDPWHHCQLLLLVFVLEGSQSTKSEVGPKLVLICISFHAREVEHFFLCCFSHWISSFEKDVFSSFAHFFIGSLIFWGA